MSVILEPVLGLPEIGPGDDLARLIAHHASIEPGDIVIITSKVISKSLGLRRPEAERIRAIGEHTRRVVAERAAPHGPTRVVESVAGPVLVAAGVDSSSTGEAGTILLLPTNPDAAAREVHLALADAVGVARQDVGVIISDSAGRPWRHGLTDFALGASGVRTLVDHRGETDEDGRVLALTVRAVADELAAAADLIKQKGARVPVAIARGLGALLGAGDARSLVRTGASDWFARGHKEAVRDALGVAPGSASSDAIGLAPTGPSPFSERVDRALALAFGGLDSWGDADALGADVEITGELARVSLTADDEYLLGVAAARLAVACAAEDLHCETERRPGSHLTTLRPL